MRIATSGDVGDLSPETFGTLLIVPSKGPAVDAGKIFVSNIMWTSLFPVIQVYTPLVWCSALVPAQRTGLIQ